jgi:predicted hydrolase (HD superfamily)
VLDKALLACDELAGFVMACSLVRPEGIRSLAPSSVKKKLKDKAFAAKIKREDVYQGVERLGANLDEHIQLVIDALMPHAETLGIAGAGR